MANMWVKASKWLRSGTAVLTVALLLAAGTAAADMSIPLVSAGDSITAEQHETAINALNAREGLSTDTRTAII